MGRPNAKGTTGVPPASPHTPHPSSPATMDTGYPMDTLLCRAMVASTPPPDRDETSSPSSTAGLSGSSGAERAKAVFDCRAAIARRQAEAACERFARQPPQPPFAEASLSLRRYTSGHTPVRRPGETADGAPPEVLLHDTLSIAVEVQADIVSETIQRKGLSLHACSSACSYDPSVAGTGPCILTSQAAAEPFSKARLFPWSIHDCVHANACMVCTYSGERPGISPKLGTPCTCTHAHMHMHMHTAVCPHQMVYVHARVQRPAASESFRAARCALRYIHAVLRMIPYHAPAPGLVPESGVFCGSKGRWPLSVCAAHAPVDAARTIQAGFTPRDVCRHVGN